jgi:hypothetical protein
MKTKRITARDVNKVLKEKGIAERLVQGRGYCYFVEGDAQSWFSSSVPVCYVNDFTVEQWLVEREELRKA